MTSPGRLHDERNALLDRETRRLRRFWLHPVVLALLACVWGAALLVGLRGERLLNVNLGVVKGNNLLEHTTLIHGMHYSAPKPMNPEVLRREQFSRTMEARWTLGGEVTIHVEQRRLLDRDHVLATFTGGRFPPRFVVGPRPVRGKVFVPDMVLALDEDGEIALAMVRRGIGDELHGLQEEWVAGHLGGMPPLPPPAWPYPLAIDWMPHYAGAGSPPLESSSTDWYWRHPAQPEVFFDFAEELVDRTLLVSLAFYEEVGPHAGQNARIQFDVPETRAASLWLTWNWHPRALLAMWLLFVAILPVPLARRMTRLIATHGVETLQLSFAEADVERALAGTWRRAWACWLGAMLAPMVLLLVVMWARLGPVFILPSFKSAVVAQTLLEPSWLGPIALLLLLSGMAGWGMLVSVLVTRPGAGLAWQCVVTLLLAAVALPVMHMVLNRLPNGVGPVEAPVVVLYSGAALTALGALAWWLAERAAHTLWRETLAAQSEGAHHE